MRNILVDTSIWSVVLRRSEVSTVANKLKEYIIQSRVKIIGPIRQEVLSGIKTKKEFNSLRLRLSPFPDLTLVTQHYEMAAAYYNDCRRAGIQGEHIDFLICAVAVDYNLAIYTSDKDFFHYRKHLPISVIESAN